MSRLSETLSLIVQPIMAAINRNQRSTDAAASVANTANKAASVLKSRITKLEAYEQETYDLANTANDTANSALNKSDASNIYLNKSDASNIYLNKSDASKVTTSGDFNDLTNIPNQIEEFGTNMYVNDVIISDNVTKCKTEYIIDTSNECFDMIDNYSIYVQHKTGSSYIYDPNTYNGKKITKLTIDNIVRTGIGVSYGNDRYFFIDGNGFIFFNVVQITNIEYFMINTPSGKINWPILSLKEEYIPKTIQRVGGDIIIPSSNTDSTKRFKITVDDSGTLTATEVT